MFVFVFYMRRIFVVVVFLLLNSFTTGQNDKQTLSSVNMKKQMDKELTKRLQLDGAEKYGWNFI